MVSIKIGVGMIGYNIGRAHAHAWNALSEYYYPLKCKPKLVGISGRTKHLAAEVAERYGFEKTYSDWHELVKDESVTVVDNCAPPAVHSESMIIAAELGKDLICEKPLARTAREAQKMLRAAEKARVRHMLGYNYRFLPAVAFVRDMIKEGLLGKIYYFKGAYFCVNGDYDDPTSEFRWQQQSKFAGYGALSDLGTHVLDLARYLVGEVSSVSGVSETYIKKRPLTKNSNKMGTVDVDDITIASLRFKDGALGLLETSWIASGRMDYLRFEVYGSLGTVRFNLEKINELEIFFRNPSSPNTTRGFTNVQVLNKDHPFVKKFWPNQGGGFSWEHTFVNELYHYVNAIEKNSRIEPQGATFYDGYRNCLIMDSIMESARSGKWVKLPD
ncbi:MAG: Gfo/Idh/MocA family protein [Nitrososphaerales archaeon]